MNLLPKFFSLLTQAFGSTDNLDNFDLDYEDKESVDTFGELMQEETEDCVELIIYIKEHADELVQQFKERTTL